ncbi:uncharacterized protein LOC141606847 [Silene latifolia]|uniref:uncharacterized protein LOC141606847 n=1 Tax=Silene latifolia TaxID=37657 RepID=UPI003D76C577
MTWRTDGKFKSSIRRNPLRDVTNSAINAPSKKPHLLKLNNKKHFTSLKKRKLHQEEEEEMSFNGDPLHRLLLLHSDVSSLLRQIDEVVVEAVKVKMDDEKSKEINSFTNVLSDVKSSLAPWILRLQKSLAAPNAGSDSNIHSSENSIGAPTLNESEEPEVGTPEPTVPESLVSPSPLVSWRANNCLAEGGKQLFLLTPLPKPTASTSKPFASVKPADCSSKATRVPSLAENGKSENNKPEIEAESPLEIPICDLSTVLTTPCLKNPPVTCVQKEPYHQFSYRKIDQFHKSTPFPVGHNRFSESTDSESSSGEVSQKLGLKYPELVGIKPSCTLRNEQKIFEASPAWIRSPPKCCTLMEPLDEKPVKHDSPLNDCLQNITSTFNQQMSLAPPNQDTETKKGNIEMVESTPVWKGCASTVRTGKRPGENTLKKELWTRFEAASLTNGFDLNFEETPHKGFLDRLEEAS